MDRRMSKRMRAGKDGFAVVPGKNAFFCRPSGAGGDPIALVEHVKNCPFLEAVQILSGVSTATAAPARQTRNDARPPKRPNLSDGWRTIWGETKPPIDTPAQAYLERRGLRLPYGQVCAFTIPSNPEAATESPGHRPAPSSA